MLKDISCLIRLYNIFFKIRNQVKKRDKLVKNRLQFDYTWISSLVR